ncbi:MAG: hypothetical protein N3E47_02195 [Candidatus Bathyarchaeota archaeon]|nr:hypothetical protein [Candidatus Bathyarchaeota archaeon]
MARKSKRETQRMLRAVVVLLRNTTWKCGRVERLIVEYLQNHLVKYGTSRSSVREISQYFNVNGKSRSELFDALRRLERRRIIEIREI